MMRSPKSLAIAIRRRNGEIRVRDAEWKSVAHRVPLLRKPFLRGGVVFLEALMNGMTAMRFSAEQMELDEMGEAEDGGGATPSVSPGPDSDASAASGSTASTSILSTLGRTLSSLLLMPWLLATGGGGGAPVDKDKEGGEALSKGMVMLTLLLGIALAVAIFKGLPHLLTYLLLDVLGTGLTVESPVFHLIDGAIKACVFVGYILLISRMPDIKRVFQYHGAEHKVIWAWESGAGLTVDAAQKQTRFHPRCGTSFLLIVILVSVAVFAAVFPIIQPYVTFFESSLLNNLVYILVKLPLMFPIAGIAYEAVRFSGMHSNKSFVRPLIWPGLAMQRLTTNEPDDSQVEIALAALRRALWREQEAREGRTGTDESEILTFNSAEEIPLPAEGIEAAYPAAA